MSDEKKEIRENEPQNEADACSVQTDSGEENICPKCGKSFADYTKLLIHVMNEHI